DINAECALWPEEIGRVYHVFIGDERGELESDGAVKCHLQFRSHGYQFFKRCMRMEFKPLQWAEVGVMQVALAGVLIGSAYACCNSCREPAYHIAVVCFRDIVEYITHSFGACGS